MSIKGYIAFDLGAESGRAILACLEADRLSLDEVHRFVNLPVRLPSGYHWNLTQLWADLVQGLRAAGERAEQRGIELVSLGVDTWGVDCGFIGKSGQLLGLPFCYRDDRHPPAMQKAFDKLGPEKIYDATGIQFLPFNTLYQCIAQYDAEPDVVNSAVRLLTMPDLLHYFFTGEAVNEATIASTTQMVDPHSGNWHKTLLKDMGLPSHMLGMIVDAGTNIGRIRGEIAQDAAVEPLHVVVPGSHDTASAVAAVPVEDSADNWAYLSSGTWSLMGAELDEPVVNDHAREANFTNERGVSNRIRFLKNISGLWLVQEVRRDYQRQGETYDYETLAALAAEAEPFRTLLNPDYPPFASPGDMLAKIDRFADATDQPQPTNPGQYVRACLESLAFAYRDTLETLERLLDKPIRLLHVVGGGGKNQLLNQMTADAIGKRVIVGPYEATAIGNALTQAMGMGDVRDLAHLRTIVRASFDLQTYEPRNPAAYDAQSERYQALKQAAVSDSIS